MSKKKKSKKDKDKHLFSTYHSGDFITIKTSLRSLLINYEKDAPIFENLVKECNEITIRVYQFIRLYLLYCYERNLEFPELNKDVILYFIRACGTRDNRGKKSKNSDFENELNTFYDTEFAPLINKPKFDLRNKSYITPYIAKQINTAFYNNLKEHFITRIRHFMNMIKPDYIHDDDFYKLKNYILSNKKDEIQEEYKEWCNSIFNHYLPNIEKGDDKINLYGYDVKVNPLKYLKYTIKMNETLENMNIDIENSDLSSEDKNKLKKKLFQPIPLRNSLIPSYLTFDTYGILSIFGEKGSSSNENKNIENRNKILGSIFNMNHKIFNKSGYIMKSFQTDGVGVSICLQKEGSKKSASEAREDENSFNENDDLYLDELNNDELKICQTKKIISVDPGKATLVYMMDNEGNQLKYGCKQREIESYRLRMNRIMKYEKKKNKIQEFESILSDSTCKTVDYLKFKEYIKIKTQINDLTRDFYENIKFRKQNWRTWIYQRKSEDQFIQRIEKVFCNKIRPKQNTRNERKKCKIEMIESNKEILNKSDLLICYGNWSNNKQMKYLMPTKGIGLRRLISKHYQVLLVDEFKTSKLCNTCHNELSNHTIKKEGYDKSIKKHRLLVCKCCKPCKFELRIKATSVINNNGSENKNIVFINRDVNACLNILDLSNEYIFKKSRNSDFCRENKNKSINDEIKYIEVKNKSKITKNKKLSKLDAISKNGISLTIE
jgi:hypothetical protein